MRNPSSEKELAQIPGVTLLALDTTDLQQIQSVAEQVVGSGGVDVVFNNAGYGLGGSLEGLTDEQIQRVVNTNLLGAIRTTKAFIPHFREKRAGLFINTTSIGGLMTVPFNSIVPCDEVGAGRLEREHGLRAESIWNRDKSH